MGIRRRVACCGALLVLAGCGSTTDTTASIAESSPPPAGVPGATTSADPDPSGASETPTVEVPMFEPSPSEITTVATVRMAEDPRAPVDDDLDRLVRAWVRYAMGDAETFPHWESISMAIGGQTVVAFDDVAAALSHRDMWKQCPADWDIYGAASCPVDILGPVRSSVVNDTVLVYSSTFGEVTCAPARSGPVPAGRVVVLRPLPPWRTCATDFAIALVADQRGLLRHVDITLSEP